MTLTLTEAGNYVCPDDPGEPGYDSLEARRSVTDEEGEILSRLAAGLRVLEIGTGLAVSTRYLASSASEVVTVDIDPWVNDPGIGNVRFMRDVPNEQFDFAFIDGGHGYADVMADIARANAPLLALHDTYLEDVARAISDSALIEVTAYQTRCKLGLYRRGSV